MDLSNDEPDEATHEIKKEDCEEINKESPVADRFDQFALFRWEDDGGAIPMEDDLT